MNSAENIRPHGEAFANACVLQTSITTCSNTSSRPRTPSFGPARSRRGWGEHRSDSCHSSFDATSGSCTHRPSDRSQISQPRPEKPSISVIWTLSERLISPETKTYWVIRNVEIGLRLEGSRVSIEQTTEPLENESFYERRELSMSEASGWGQQMEGKLSALELFGFDCDSRSGLLEKDPRTGRIIPTTPEQHKKELSKSE